MATSILITNPIQQFPQFPKPKSLLAKSVPKSPYSHEPTIFKPLKTEFPGTRTHLSRSYSSFRLLAVGDRAEGTENDSVVGEDSAEFNFSEQKVSSWIYFTGILGVVLYVLNVVWIDNSTGFGKDFISAVSSISESHEV